MLVGKSLGPYVIDKELGSGAMGTVFRAMNKDTGERVAIKLMAPALGTNDQARARFEREFKILQQLRHPGIVQFIRSGRYHSSPFFIMEYVQGDSLDRVMERRDRVTWEEIVEMGTQLCSALTHAHEKGIIHRDLKPSNVMILRDGTVKLTDFGIAKDTDVTALTAANSTVGTASYMSPEQCRGARDITAKSDLYSMGIMFYELLTGRKPFFAETPVEMFLQHASGTFTPPSKLVPECPPWLNTLICQLMEKKPEQRPFNADAVAQGLALVKDKMTVQQSAGLDAAKKRRIDRSTTDVALDDTDKDAARVLLGKKKKKKKAAPFYTRGWFTVLALAVLGVAALATVYFAFFRAPSADRLYTEAAALMKSQSDDDHKAAREGPIATFLAAYPSDDKARQVQAWADQVDCEVAERQMLVRRSRGINVTTSDEERKAEEKARTALDNEDLGKLDTAAEYWQELLRYKTDKERPEQRPWGLIAEKYLKGLAEAKANERYLLGLLQLDKEGADDYEKTALQALREESAGKWKDARDSWGLLKNRTAEDPELRGWHLLAARKKRELDNK
jgi:eukaryotic-like serine/threonine-protein kinase